ncbi:MAG: 3-deoxy-7-phosphoheptulonate synthase [candidate division Zixibacteria bacterium]|nr:3-deoxy-7-phosphoheptulonate synthase [candidate division Zixibacteria bacterium]
MTVVVMRPGATVREISSVLKKVESLGYRPHLSQGNGRTAIGLIGNGSELSLQDILSLPGVAEIAPVAKPFKLGSREFRNTATEVAVGDVVIGGDRVIMMAGPCSVESREQTMMIAESVAGSGGHILRGGAFKPRTSPYSFRGLGEAGLKILAEARQRTGLPIVTEVLSAHDVDLVCEYADIIQIGARNMQNFALLDELGRLTKPILLKRGLMSTIEELLMSAEYILAGGNPNVILCERGIRSFEKYTRNTLDIAAVPVLKQLSHLPVVVDPSHATGRRDLVAPVARAAIAAGADGLIVETHQDPDHALSDGDQSLTLSQFEQLMSDLRALASAVGRSM